MGEQREEFPITQRANLGKISPAMWEFFPRFKGNIPSGDCATDLLLTNCGRCWCLKTS